MTELPPRDSQQPPSKPIPTAEPPVPDIDHPAHARTKPLPRHRRSRPPPLLSVLVAWLGAFAGILALATVVDLFPRLQLLVIGSFGASAVLLFGAPRAPFSQPRNLIGGHLISALVGVACYRYLPDLPQVPGLVESAAVATSIALMLLTHTTHPPGGATALIAVIGSDGIHELGWGYVFPVLAGAAILLLVALIGNNLHHPGSYPDRWD